MEFNKLVSQLQTSLCRSQSLVSQVQAKYLEDHPPINILKRAASELPLLDVSKVQKKTLGFKGRTPVSSVIHKIPLLQEENLSQEEDTQEN